MILDPFGNYLCQKMLEKCNHEQRTVIVETVAPELVKIALNMHGTRAVQKLIEYLSTPQQASKINDKERKKKLIGLHRSKLLRVL